MNKIYDKLLLALAVLALLGGVGFYMVKSGAAPSGKVPVSTQTADNPYQAVPVPGSEDSSAIWPETPVQSTGWIYDIFTPPKIYLDKDGNFTSVPPKGTNEALKEPFGVYLAGIERKLYRIQIEGYVEEDLTDASKSLLLLFDEERGQSVRARIGREVAKSAFEVLDFDIVRDRDADGNINKVAKATILDKRSGQEVVLVHGERLFDDGVTVNIRSKEDASVEIELSEAGQRFETALGEYVLKQINLEESTVTVEKLGNEEREAETKVLAVNASTSQGTTPSKDPATDTEDTSSANGFDFAF